MINRLRDWIVEALFPPFCVSCNTGGDWWCESCREKTELMTTDPCPACFALIHAEECHATSALDGVSAAGVYHDVQLRKALWSLKYRGGTCVVPSIRLFLKRWKSERYLPWAWAGKTSAALVPIPTSERRRRERGFDQAELLADAIREEIIPWAQSVNLLQRTRSVSAQAALAPGPLRRANVRNAFSVVSHASLPETVILVDDVATSGATVRQAAETLKQAGVQYVYAIVLAIGA